MRRRRAVFASGLALLALTVLDDVAGLGFVRHLELVARFGHALQSENFHGSGRFGLLNGLAAIVKHCSNFAVHRADDEHIADAQGSVLYQHGSHRSSALIHAGFENGAAARSVGIGLEFAQIADEQNHLEQARQIFLGLGGDFHHHRVATPFLGHQAAVGELALHALGQSLRLVDFIYGDNDGHVGGFGVRNSFFRLRHHAIVRGYDQDDNVRNLCAARTHSRERFMARCVDKNDPPLVNVRFIRADMLRNSACFARRYLGFADGIKQAGLAVVHVAHHGDYRSARQLVSTALFLDFFFLDYLLFKGHDLDDSVERLRQAGRGGDIESLVDAGENAAVEQGFQQVLGANIHLLGKLANGDAFRHRDVPRLALHGGHRFSVSRASCSHTRARANRVQPALTFGIAFFDRRTSA